MTPLTSLGKLPALLAFSYYGPAMNRSAPAASHGQYARFAQFYPFYLSEHSNRACRRLHFAGTVLALSCLAIAAVRRDPRWILAVPLAGYGLAWIGHFFFEHNRPATFRHPWYSLMGDFVMFRDMLAGRIRF